MDSHPNQKWIDQTNAETLYHIKEQARTVLGVTPFVGAGISTAFGLKDWKGLLLGATPPGHLSAVESLLASGDYEGAAEILLKHLGPDGFQNMVAASAGDSNIDAFDFRSGVVSLLPLLATGPVVTTNFDRVLERAFEANAAAFESVISGPKPDLIVVALHHNRRVLIKLHGDWEDRVGRTFARSDYEANYGDEQPELKRELLTGAERLLFSSRSLLFIGASLGVDRTVRLLQDIHKEHAGIRHFAIMKAPLDSDEFAKKERDLRTCGVMPLWYIANSPAEHQLQVERIVADIIEQISVKTMTGQASTTLAPHANPAVRKRPTVPLPVELDAHFDRMVRLIEDGRLTFFLGTAIYHPNKLGAKEFYKGLARLFQCEALADERFAAGQYIADRHGRDCLYAEIRKLFTRAALTSQDTHEFFAAWREFKTHTGEPLPFPMIITTNYDDILERRLADAGLPYHLFSYQSDGPHRRLFFHRDPNDGLRIIERPRNIRTLSDGFILVKINGGIDRQRRIRESYVTTRLDYWDLAVHIPDVLPALIQEKLLATQLLFIGHGLAAADVESLVRFAHKHHPGQRSWAVVFKNEGIEYWRQCGLEIINQPVNPYVIELGERLAQNASTLGT